MRLTLGAPIRDEYTHDGLPTSGTDASITVRWSHPIDNGGDPITYYKMYVDDGNGGAFSASSEPVGTPEVQRIADNGAVSGTFEIQYLGATSAPLNVKSAEASDVKAALEGMQDTRFTPARYLFPQVEVTRVGASSPYQWDITFVLGATGDLPLLTLETSNIVGSAPSISELVKGAGHPEVQQITTSVSSGASALTGTVVLKMKGNMQVEQTTDPVSLWNVDDGAAALEVKNALDAMLKKAVGNNCNNLGCGSVLVWSKTVDLAEQTRVFTILFQRGYYPFQREGFEGSQHLITVHDSSQLTATSGTATASVTRLSMENFVIQ